jgi:cytochrome c553
MRKTRPGAGLFLAMMMAPSGAGIAFALDLEHHPGKAIYEKMCIDCHAKDGGGVEGKADDPLVGARTLESLAERIDRTMPEDQPELLNAEESKTVAAYIYDAFYSAEARARNTPARIDLSRLTVPQYRNSVADLVLGFRGDNWISEKRGLKASYFGDRGHNERKEFREQKKPDKFERIDGTVKFDFGEGIPKHAEVKEFSPEQFSIRWEGTILPEETGVHEFVVKTRNGVTLWVNDHDRGEESDQKTIDGWVVPHNEVREETGRVFLIGGRPYPIRLDFFTYKEKAASVELLWKPPHGILETIPERNLVPEWSHESLLVDVPFPADDRSVGYERGTMVSKAWLESVTAGAAMASDHIVDHLDELAKIKREEPAPERAKKIDAFAEAFVARAFRRPLTDEEKERFVRIHFKGSPSPEQAVKRLVLQTLSSPRFLYPEVGVPAKPDSWAVASRLALFLWDSVPNERLLERVRKGELDKPEKLAEIVNESVWNWRTRAKMRGFYHDWLEMERADELVKDKGAFPEFDPAVATDLRTSLHAFLDEATWGKKAGYREILLSTEYPLNERLGRVYGVDVKGGFQPVSLDGGKRAGLITHPFVLSYLAYHNNTSPIHRGVFLTRHIIGMPLKSPPMANDFKDSKFDPSLTMREKVVSMTKSQDCMGCHVTINPLGFSLEHFDGIGRWREQDRGKPVDAKADFRTEDGRTLALTGPRDVAEFAANTPSAHRTFIEKLFHHLVKQPVRAYGEDEMETLRKGFEEGGYQIPDLIKRIALSTVQQGKAPDERFASK